jgi:hypothetical protein
MDACPTCGAPRDISMRSVAIQAGLPANTVSRFLRGSVIESDAIDALEAWLTGYPRAQ